jgi:zinc/manganese transport system substrate-binding protein
MKKLLLLLLALPLWSAVAQKEKPASPKIKVVTTLEVLRALTKEVGGDLVEVNSLSQASEDPHFIKARPTFNELVRKADVLVKIGRDLELWLPLVTKAAGAKDQIEVVASSGVKTLDVPKELTRSAGDVHPQGNPHIWLSPTAALKMAENIRDGLNKKDPAHKKSYDENFVKFKQKLAESLFGPHKDLKGKTDLFFRYHQGKKLESYLKDHKGSVGGWLKLAKNIDYSFITYHSVWSYMADEFALKVFAQIEEKSGIDPSLKYQNELIKKAKEASVRHIVAASYYKSKAKLMDVIASQIGGEKLLLDVDCQKDESYIAMIDRLLNALAKFKELPKK